MKSCVRSAVLAAVLSSSMPPVAVPAAAEQVAAANFGKLRQTRLYAKSIIDGAHATTAWVNDRCEDARASLGETLAVVSGPVRVDERGRPQSGSWIEHVTMEGCGRTRQLNVLAMVRAPGMLATVPLLPGTTRADPLLQKDGALYAFTAAVDPRKCEPVFIADTAYVGPLGQASLVPGKPGWSERWTVSRCGEPVAVDMGFMPDATGTMITAHRAPP